MNLSPHVYQAIKNRRERQASSFYSSVVALTNPLTIVFGSFISVSYSEDLLSDQLTITSSRGKVFTAPALTAGALHLLQYFEKNESLSFACLVPGTLSVYRLDGIGRNFKIAEGSLA